MDGFLDMDFFFIFFSVLVVLHHSLLSVSRPWTFRYSWPVCDKPRFQFGLLLNIYSCKYLFYFSSWHWPPHKKMNTLNMWHTQHFLKKKPLFKKIVSSQGHVSSFHPHTSPSYTEKIKNHHNSRVTTWPTCSYSRGVWRSDEELWGPLLLLYFDYNFFFLIFLNYDVILFQLSQLPLVTVSSPHFFTFLFKIIGQRSKTGSNTRPVSDCI